MPMTGYEKRTRMWPRRLLGDLGVRGPCAPWGSLSLCPLGLLGSLLGSLPWLLGSCGPLVPWLLAPWTARAPRELLAALMTMPADRAPSSRTPKVPLYRGPQ